MAIISLLLYPGYAPGQNNSSSQAERSATQKESRSGDQSPNLEYVLTNYYKAIGGVLNWRNVQTLVITGTLDTGSAKLSTIARNMRPDKCMVVYSKDDLKIIQAYNGSSAWELNPLTGINEPQVIKGELSESIKDKCDIEGPLIEFREKNLKVQLEGKEKVKDVESYKIKINYPSGNVQYYFIDSETFLPLKTVRVIKSSGGENTVTTTFRNYRKSGGIVVPHLLIFENTGQTPPHRLIIDSVKVNSPIDTDVFTMP